MHLLLRFIDFRIAMSLSANALGQPGSVPMVTILAIHCLQGSCRPRARRVMYGIAVIFKLPDMDGNKHCVFEDFFFSHFSLIEFRLQALYHELIKAILSLMVSQTLRQSSTKQVG